MTGLRDRLIALRKKRGLSQSAIAKLVGVSQPVIADFEIADRRRSIDLAMRIAEALGAEVRVRLVERPRSKRRGVQRAA